MQFCNHVLVCMMVWCHTGGTATHRTMIKGIAHWYVCVSRGSYAQNTLIKRNLTCKRSGENFALCSKWPKFTAYTKMKGLIVKFSVSVETPSNNGNRTINSLIFILCASNMLYKLLWYRDYKLQCSYIILFYISDVCSILIKCTSFGSTRYI